MTKTALLTLCAAPLVLSACDTAEMEVLEGTGTEAVGKIFGGSAPDAPEHDAVVSLHTLARGGKSVYVSPFCSGTLITEDVVLTAAHCVSNTSANKVAVYVGDEPAVDIVSHLYTVSEVLVHDQYSSAQILNDIALLRLDNAVTEAVTPVEHLPSADGFTSADIGTTVNFAGFGDDEYGNSGVKLQVDGTLGALGCGVSGCPDGGDTATQVSYSQTTAGPCFGDSGGPMFVYRAGGTYVGGITSYGDSYCTIYGVSTRVDAFESFIEDFLGTGDSGEPCASSESVCDDGIDDDCDGFTDCDDSDCAADAACSSTCDGDGVCEAGEDCGNCASDCDGKTTGKPSKRYCCGDGTADSAEGDGSICDGNY